MLIPLKYQCESLCDSINHKILLLSKHRVIAIFILATRLPSCCLGRHRFKLNDKFDLYFRGGRDGGRMGGGGGGRMGGDRMGGDRMGGDRMGGDRMGGGGGGMGGGRMGGGRGGGGGGGSRNGGMGGGFGGGRGMGDMGGDMRGGGGMGGGRGDNFNQNFTQDTMGGMGNQGMMFGNQQTTTTQVSIPKDVSTFR